MEGRLQFMCSAGLSIDQVINYCFSLKIVGKDWIVAANYMKFFAAGKMMICSQILHLENILGQPSKLGSRS